MLEPFHVLFLIGYHFYLPLIAQKKFKANKTVILVPSTWCAVSEATIIINNIVSALLLLVTLKLKTTLFTILLNTIIRYKFLVKMFETRELLSLFSFKVRRLGTCTVFHCQGAGTCYNPGIGVGAAVRRADILCTIQQPFGTTKDSFLIRATCSLERSTVCCGAGCVLSTCHALVSRSRRTVRSAHLLASYCFGCFRGISLDASRPLPPTNAPLPTNGATEETTCQGYGTIVRQYLFITYS